MALTNEQKDTLLKTARLAIETYVRQKRIISIEITDATLNEGRGAFVSLHKGEDLRGCIGKFDFDTPLYKNVIEMAVEAATMDPRFDAVEPDELKDIIIEISALTPLKEVADKSEITVGTHGLYIIKGRCRGVLLPQVAVECCLDRDEFLDHTCLKAGLPTGAWENGAKIYTFEAEIFKEKLPAASAA